MHSAEAVLLSPVSVDTTARLGFVSSPTSSSGDGTTAAGTTRGGATGFAEQLSSADSALAAAPVPLPPAVSGKVIAVSGGARRRSSQAEAPPNEKTNDERSNGGQPRSLRTAAAPGPGIPPSFVPANDTGLTPAIIATSIAATPIAQGFSENSGRQLSAAAIGGSFLKQSLTPGSRTAFQTSAVPTGGQSAGVPEQLAFAVRVRPAAPVASGGAVNATEAPRVRVGESPVAMAKQAGDASADQPPATANAAAAKVADMKESVEPGPQQIPSAIGAVTVGSSLAIVHADSASSGSAWPNLPAVANASIVPVQSPAPTAPVKGSRVRIESSEGQDTARTVPRTGDLQTGKSSPGNTAATDSESANASADSESLAAITAGDGSAAQAAAAGNDATVKVADMASSSPITQAFASATAGASWASQPTVSDEPIVAAKPSVPSAGVPAAPTKDSRVRIEPSQSQNASVPGVPRAGDPQAGGTSSARTAASDSENHAAMTRQARDSSAEQAPSAGNDATAKAADKKISVDTSQQIPATAGGAATGNGSTIIHADFAVDASRQSAAAIAKPGGSSAANGPAIVNEPIVAIQPATPTAPMKDIAVRIESGQGQNVDVRIVQRAGDLQIAVTSADADTTQGLRRGLSELTNRLNESGYQAETWRPGQPAAASETSADTGSSSHQQPSGNSQSNSNSGSSQQDRGQHDNNPSNRPRWVQELESNLAGGAESTGQFHGLIS